MVDFGSFTFVVGDFKFPAPSISFTIEFYLEKTYKKASHSFTVFMKFVVLN